MQSPDTDSWSLENSASSPGRMSRDGAPSAWKPIASACATESFILLEGRVKPRVVISGHPASP